MAGLLTRSESAACDLRRCFRLGPLLCGRAPDLRLKLAADEAAASDNLRAEVRRALAREQPVLIACASQSWVQKVADLLQAGGIASAQLRGGTGSDDASLLLTGLSTSPGVVVVSADRNWDAWPNLAPEGQAPRVIAYGFEDLLVTPERLLAQLPPPLVRDRPLGIVRGDSPAVAAGLSRLKRKMLRLSASRPGRLRQALERQVLRSALRRAALIRSRERAELDRFDEHSRAALAFAGPVSERF